MNRTTAATHRSKSYPPLPIDTEHWLAIVQAMELSPQQARIAEHRLRGMALKEIAVILGITVPTVRSHLQRIHVRTGTRDKMELAMRVLAVSHQVKAECERHPNG